MQRLFIVAALLVLLTACTAPSPASMASTAPPSFASALPSPTAFTSAAPTSPATASTATPIALPSFAQLSAPSGNVVWALIAGTRLFRSTDRGDTWQERSAALTPFGPDREIAFISDTEGWLATPGQPGTQCTFQSVGIAHSVDVAGKWEQLVVGALPGSSGPSELVRQCKGGLAFADQQHGFLGAWDPNSPPVIYRTTDGGSFWSASSPLPDPPGFTTRPAVGALRAGRVHAFGATLLVVASGEVNGRGVGYVYRSVDGGASWSYAVTLPDTLGAFAFVSESRWLQIALAASSKETTDGGATWHAFTSDYSQAAGVAPTIVFGDALVGYATVRGAIQRTVDGGAHWTPLNTPGT